MSALETAPPEKEISIVLPVYNEALGIRNCINEVEQAARSFSGSYEIIVAEDGSTDGTNCILANLSKSNPHLRFLHSSVRLGKGRAIKNALEQSRGAVIVFMDADLATSLDYLPRILQSIKEHGGLTIGSRHVEGSLVTRRTSRTFFSLAYNLFVRMLFLDGIHDHQCGFKAMTRDVVTVVLDTKSDDFFFDTEMILRCKKHGFPVTEIGVEWTETRGKSESKVKLFRDAERIGLDLLAFRLFSLREIA